MQLAARLRISAEELDRESEQGARAPLSSALGRAWQPSTLPVRRQPVRPRLAPRDSLGVLASLQATPWSPPGQHPPTEKVSPSDVEPEIDALYRQARQLIPLAAIDPAAEARYQATIQRLRELQQQEAERWAARFDAQRIFPPGERRAALHRADALIAKYAHLAPENSPAEDADHPTSSTARSE